MLPHFTSERWSLVYGLSLLAVKLTLPYPKVGRLRPCYRVDSPFLVIFLPYELHVS